MTRAWGGEAFRFLLAGAFNTIATYALYLLMLQWLNYNVAYTIVVIVGIALSYALNVAFVFRVRPQAHTALAFPLIYAVQYVIGLAALNLAVKSGVPSRYALVASIATTVPVTSC